MSHIDDRKTWLESLKAGDVVGRYEGFSGIPRAHKVDRVTATQIIIGTIRFSRKYGYAIGSYSRFVRPSIVQITKDILEKMERRDLISWAANRNWNQSTTEQLRAMKKAHEELTDVPASNKEQA